MEEALDLVADLAEDLAVEILAHFQPADYPNLGHTISKFVRVEKMLTEANKFVPSPVQEILKTYRSMTN